MTRAAQCLEDRIHIQEFERARLIRLRDSILADDEVVASLSVVLTTHAADLAEPTIRTQPNQPKKP